MRSLNSANRDDPTLGVDCSPSRATTLSARTGLLAFACLAATFAAYLPALSGDYIWTDLLNVQGQPRYGPLRELWRIWSSTDTEQYFPLSYTSFWLERQLWGLRPIASHVINVALHGLNALLFLAVLKRLRIRGAWFAAAIFALHPLHVESVAWIIERKNVLSGAFYLLALRSFLAFDDTTQRTSYWSSLAFFALALLSKSAAVSLPLALVLCRVQLRRSWSPRSIAQLAPFFLMSLSMALVTVVYEHKRNVFLEYWLTAGLSERIAISGLNLWFYLAKLLMPVRLALVYEKWQIDPWGLMAYLPTLALCVLAGLLWTMRRRLGLGPLLALVFFVGALLPVLGPFRFYYQVVSDVADHFVYLPSLAIIAVVAGGTASGTTRWFRSGGPRRAIVQTGALALLAVLGIATWQRCHVYKDDYTMWRDTLEKSPGAWDAHRFFARAAWNRGQAHVALRHFREEIRLHPRNVSAYNDLGGLYSRLGQPAPAENMHRAAIQIDARIPGSYLALGDLHASMGRFEEAITEYEQAMQRGGGRGRAMLHSRIGAAYGGLGQWEAALEQYRHAVRIDPFLVAAHQGMQGVLSRLGRSEEAAEHGRRALELMRRVPEAQRNG